MADSIEEKDYESNSGDLPAVNQTVVLMVVVWMEKEVMVIGSGWLLVVIGRGYLVVGGFMTLKKNSLRNELRVLVELG